MLRSPLEIVRQRLDLMRTFLERYVPLFAPGLSAPTIGRLWRMRAHTYGTPLNTARLAGSLERSASTVNRYVDILERPSPQRGSVPRSRRGSPRPCTWCTAAMTAGPCPVASRRYRCPPSWSDWQKLTLSIVLSTAHLAQVNSIQQRLTAALGRSYRVERELGAGGMATVYLAHDLKHEREVAIKVLHPDLGAALGRERFLAKIKTTAKLQHPHILPLLDSGAADGLLYYVMPYVRGETLRALGARASVASARRAAHRARSTGRCTRYRWSPGYAAHGGASANARRPSRARRHRARRVARWAPCRHRVRCGAR
ncbi:MAG: protein kinase [Gemmatimonas sp.]|nr:protein kinase [Gemmatimonas sp.]